jgi:asparagine synthase (glutamine-hydrolysing)
MPARTAVAERLAGVDGDPLAAMLFLDGQLGLVDDMLHYFDRASMAHSLEVRVPFLDHHVVEFASRIPTELKVHGMTTKYLLKRAARGIVPDRIIDKPKIGFFNAAVGAWFKAQTNGAIKDYLLAPDAAYGGLLQRAEVERLVADHAAGSSARGTEHALLSILMLEVWLSDVLPRALAPADRGRDRIVVAG